MTVVYPDRGFLKLLFRWRGSLWKATLKEYVIWLTLYFAISLTYRFGMNSDQQAVFFVLVRQFATVFKMIPLEFLLESSSLHPTRWVLSKNHQLFTSVVRSVVVVLGYLSWCQSGKLTVSHPVLLRIGVKNASPLMMFTKAKGLTVEVKAFSGFYVSGVVGRWWSQFMCITWPDQTVTTLCGLLPGYGKEDVRIRSTITRWVNLMCVLSWQWISTKTKKRFPTYQHIVNAGLMTPVECEMLMNVPGEHGRYFVVHAWCLNLLSKCKEAGRISEFAHIHLIKVLWKARINCGMLNCYDWVDLPLLYTQVVTVATYGYFAIALMGRQWLLKPQEESDNYLDMVFPFFTSMQFFFYFSWLKVGETLRCPFGEDDDDFDMNYILDRNVHFSKSYLNIIHYQNPPLDLKHDLLTKLDFSILPHTKASMKVKEEYPWSRIQHVNLKPDEQEMAYNSARIRTGWRHSLSSIATSTAEDIEPIRDRYEPTPELWRKPNLEVIRELEPESCGNHKDIVVNTFLPEIVISSEEEAQEQGDIYSIKL